MAISLNNRKTQIHVATSDFTEQWAIFGQGALRKSARELLIEMSSIEKGIEKNVKKIQEKKPISKIPISDEMAEIFEKWRRGRKVSVDFKIFLLYTNGIYACSVEGIYFEYGLRNKNQRTISRYGRRRNCRFGAPR